MLFMLHVQSMVLIRKDCRYELDLRSGHATESNDER